MSMKHCRLIQGFSSLDPELEHSAEQGDMKETLISVNESEQDRPEWKSRLEGSRRSSFSSNSPLRDPSIRTGAQERPLFITTPLPLLHPTAQSTPYEPNQETSGPVNSTVGPQDIPKQETTATSPTSYCPKSLLTALMRAKSPVHQPHPLQEEHSDSTRQDHGSSNQPEHNEAKEEALSDTLEGKVGGCSILRKADFTGREHGIGIVEGSLSRSSSRVQSGGHSQARSPAGLDHSVGVLPVITTSSETGPLSTVPVPALAPATVPASTIVQINSPPPPTTTPRRTCLTFAVVPPVAPANTGTGTGGRLNGRGKDGYENRVDEEEEEENDDVDEEQDDEDEDEEEEDEEEDEEDEIKHTGYSGEQNGSTPHSRENGSYPTPISEVVDSMSDTENDDDDEEEEEEEDEEEDEDSEEEDDNPQDLDDDFQGTGSGYEEDSEAGFSSDNPLDDEGPVFNLLKTLGKSPRPRRLGRVREGEEDEDVKETRMVSPRGRRGLLFSKKGKLVMEERDASYHMTSRSNDPDELDVEVESTSLRPRQKYSFARPTNYRRRRPVSDVMEEIIGGSASSLIAPSSYVRIQQESTDTKVERGRGSVQIQHARPPRATRVMSNAKSGTESCTRHRSPPPRTRTKSNPTQSTQLQRSASDRVGGMTAVFPAEMSPSAGRLKIKRGVSDSPRKRRAREGEILALGRRKRDEDERLANSAVCTTTESEAPAPEPRFGPGNLSALRGWRSDDAVFAVPTVRRHPPPITTNHLSTTPTMMYAERPLTPLSPLKKTRWEASNPSSRAESACESDQTGFTGHRSASERVVNGMISVLRRASETVQPFFRAETPLGEPFSTDRPVGSGLETPSFASRPCEVAIDMTPALGLKSDYGKTSAPVEQVLHQTLVSGSYAFPSVLANNESTLHTNRSGYATEGNLSRHVSYGKEELPKPRRASRGDAHTPTGTAERSTSRPIQCPLPKRETGF